MGLDMYLSKKTYVKRWSHQSPEEQHSVEVKKGGVLRTDIKPERISYITEEIMYWRKANQIHGWFCSNTAEVNDNVNYNVSFDDLVKLVEDCKKVLEILNNSKKITTQVSGGYKNGEPFMVDVEVYDNVDEIMDILPPTQGFFFGSDTIDDYYKQDIEDTIKVIEEEILVGTDDYADYEYYASW